MKKILILIIVILFFIIGFCVLKMPKKEKSENKMLEGKNILIVIAPQNFRDEELFTPKEYFENLKANVVVASLKKGTAKGMLGRTIEVEKTISEISVDNFDAIVFPGGIGVDEFETYENEEYVNLAKEAFDKGKVIGAICLAPKILANAGILDGKNATVWESGADYLKNKGVNYIKKDVVISGKIVTGNNPGAAEKFAKEIAKLI